MRRSRAALAAGAVASAVSAALAVPAATADGSALYREGSVVAQLRGATVSLRASPGSEQVLALSGHQTHLPAGWSGGDRLAIHGGGGLGSAVSSGCVHAGATDLRWLIRRIPLGRLVVTRVVNRGPLTWL